MAFLGRESEADKQRIERMRVWIHARTPYALISLALGLLAVVDFWTLILGVAAGVAAIVTGRRGLHEIRANPQLLGRRLCASGIALGGLGIALSLFMWKWGFAMLPGA